MGRGKEVGGRRVGGLSDLSMNINSYLSTSAWEALYGAELGV